MMLGYTLRSIWARKFGALVPACSIAITVGGVATGAAYVQGFEDVLSRTSPSIAVVFTPDAVYEASSTLDREQVLRAAVLAPNSVGRPTASDLVATLPVGENNARFRGIVPHTASMHGGVSIPDGLLREGELGVLVGAALVKDSPELTSARTIRVADTQLPIVGRLDAPGTPYESEIWCDISTLTHVLRKSTWSTLRLQFETPAAAAAVQKDVARIFGGALDALPERKFFEAIFSRSEAGSHRNTVIAMAVLLALAGLLANVNAMYSVALGRGTEFFTLSILGFSRMRVTVLILQESLLLSLVAGAVGIAVARAVSNGELVLLGATQVYTTVRFSPMVFVIAIAIVTIVGLAGGAIAAAQASASRK